MRTKRILQGLMAVVAIPAILVATSGSAMANGQVSWRNATFTNSCLQWHHDPNTVLVASCSGGPGVTAWMDYHQSDGSWQEKPMEQSAGGGNINMCLTGWGDNDVTLEPCWADDSLGNQRWDEIQANGGWKLRNHRNGNYLDTDGRRVYLEPANNGNNQVWH